MVASKSILLPTAYDAASQLPAKLRLVTHADMCVHLALGKLCMSDRTIMIEARLVDKDMTMQAPTLHRCPLEYPHLTVMKVLAGWPDFRDGNMVLNVPAENTDDGHARCINLTAMLQDINEWMEKQLYLHRIHPVSCWNNHKGKCYEVATGPGADVFRSLQQFVVEAFIRNHVPVSIEDPDAEEQRDLLEIWATTYGRPHITYCDHDDDPAHKEILTALARLAATELSRANSISDCSSNSRERSWSGAGSDAYSGSSCDEVDSEDSSSSCNAGWPSSSSSSMYVVESACLCLEQLD